MLCKKPATFTNLFSPLISKDIHGVAVNNVTATPWNLFIAFQ
jgi:hypothetical protein